MFFFKPLSPSKANWSISRNPSKAPAPYCGCWLTNQPARRSLMRPWGHGSWWKAPNLVTMTLWICKSYEYPAIDLISRWHGCHTTFGHTNHPALSLPAFIYIYIDEWICIYIYTFFLHDQRSSIANEACRFPACRILGCRTKEPSGSITQGNCPEFHRGGEHNHWLKDQGVLLMVQVWWLKILRSPVEVG